MRSDAWLLTVREKDKESSPPCEIMGKEKVYTNPVRCKGCGYCMNACPQEAIRESGHVNAKGYNTVEVDAEKCVVCGMCYRVCPDYVFEIR